MAALGCVLWWIVAGFLLGWFFSWLVGSMLKRQFAEPFEQLAERPIERIVEKAIDNPGHLSRIEQLESELQNQLSSLESAPPQVIEKQVDNPAHLIRIRELESEVAQIAALRSQIQSLQSVQPTVVEKIVEKPIETVVEKIVYTPVANANLNTKGLEERDPRLQDWESRFAELERRAAEHVKAVAARDEELRRYKTGPAIDLDAAKALGFHLKGADDLEIIEGIGPKIAELFHQTGIKSFKQLSEMTPELIQPILDRAGPNFRMANPETWPAQADLAARNRWRTLRLLQEALTGGVRGDDK